VDQRALPRSRWPATLAIIGWTLLLGGCRSDSSPPDAVDTGPAATVGMDIQLVCTDHPFPADRLSVRGAESEPGPTADALRAVLATNAGFIEGVPFPKSGWTRPFETSDEVQFVALETRRLEDRPWYLIAFELRNGRWDRTYTGECRLRPAGLQQGFGAGEWWLATSAEPTDRMLSIFVREAGCTVGPAQPARIGTPMVAPREEVVKVVIPVRTSDDGRCTGATPATIDIGMPLGKRRLVDAGAFPARDVRQSPP
jgi:hypothetical protein